MQENKENILTIKERILKFVKDCGIQKSIFFKEIGVNASNFKGENLNSTPGGGMLVKILTKYPRLSAEWLMRGSGEMLIEEDSKKTENKKSDDMSHQTDSSSRILLDLIDKKDKQLMEQSETIGRLKELVKRQEESFAESPYTEIDVGTVS